MPEIPDGTFYLGVIEQQLNSWTATEKRLNSLLQASCQIVRSAGILNAASLSYLQHGSPRKNGHHDVNNRS